VKNTVLERVIDDWLTKTTERAFQAPFCQMLAARGETIVHSTRHSAMELGKDIISIAPGGKVHAYQLKTAPRGRLSLREWRAGLQQQAFDLVTSAVRHPSITSKRHHRSFFVINGEIDEEVAEDISRQNEAWARNQLPAYRLETIVRGELAGMATKLQAAFWPEELADVNALLELYLDSGRGQLPKEKVARLLEATTLAEATVPRGNAECLRQLSSAGVLCALSMTRFSHAENHLAEIEGWSCYLAVVMGAALKYKLPERPWRSSVDLASTIVAGLLEDLVRDVEAHPKMVVGNPLSDHPMRAVRLTHLVAMFSALWLWRRSLTLPVEALDEFIREFCTAHRTELFLWGEAAAPQLLAAYWGLRSMAPQVRPDEMVLAHMDWIIRVNGRNGPGRLLSPYYNAEEAYGRLFGFEEEGLVESFRCRSHSLESFLAIVTRENLKQAVRLRWRDISHIMFAHFQTAKPWQEALWRNAKRGKLVLRMPKERQSWNELRQLYDFTEKSAVARLVIQFPIQWLLVLMVYPHRLRAATTVALDRAIMHSG